MNNTNRYNSNHMTSNRQNVNGSYQVSLKCTFYMSRVLFSVEFIKSGYDESCSSRPEASWYTIIKSNSETEASYACTKKYSTCTGQRRQGKIHFYPKLHHKKAILPKSHEFLIDFGHACSCRFRRVIRKCTNVWSRQAILTMVRRDPMISAFRLRPKASGLCDSLSLIE